MSPVATSDAAFRGGACPTPEYTVTYTGNYTTSADASQINPARSRIPTPLAVAVAVVQSLRAA